MTAEPMDVSPTTSSNVSTYPQVKHKQNEGSLVLSFDKLSFQPATAGPPSDISWSSVTKHQVSPASHSKALLKIVLNNGKSVTLRLVNRQELERIRKDISARLNASRASAAGNAVAGATTNTATTNGSKKRTHSQLSYGEMDKRAVAVTRSALLAANPTLRDQHRYLVTETQTVSEEDFWSTHKSLVEEEYAKISGATRAGTSSLLQSHLPLQGKVTLGVEEMRQIFVLYPAVHKAYEERVPLELSDEQFWKKYLESEFFHRDRGRLGTTAKNHGVSESKQKANDTSNNNNKMTAEEQDARAAAVGTDDFFSRYDAKLRQEEDGSSPKAPQAKRQWGTRLAVGQFDLASTLATERGHLLEGPRDEYPPNADTDGKGARVIQKYNRHWAMVLHPDEAVAGSNLTEVARRSAEQDYQAYQKANPLGGTDEEMRRLVKYANASEEDANHVLGSGIDDDDYEPLNLSNIEAYYNASQKNGTTTSARKESDEEVLKCKTVFAKAMAAKMQTLAAPYSASKENGGSKASSLQPQDTLPPNKLGRELLGALSKKMAADAQTEADALAVVDALPEEFKKKLNTYFRRSSELLRHFFGLRKLEAQGNYQNSQKLARIVQGLEAVYREMESMRKELPQTKDGEQMAKMCLPIMDQLDCAFQLHRDQNGSAGGFVTVEDI